MEERWAPIAGFEGLYEVSSFGRVKHLAYARAHWRGGVAWRKEHVLRANTAPDYPQVLLHKDGKRTSASLHRLVAEHFLDRQNLPEVNHKDGNRLNANVGNLEWCDRRHNIAHAVKAGRFNPVTNAKMARKLDLPSVMSLRSEYAAGAPKLRLAKKYLISRAMVSAIVSGRSWKVV